MTLDLLPLRRILSVCCVEIFSTSLLRLNKWKQRAHVFSSDRSPAIFNHSAGRNPIGMSPIFLLRPSLLHCSYLFLFLPHSYGLSIPATVSLRLPSGISSRSRHPFLGYESRCSSCYERLAEGRLDIPRISNPIYHI